MNLERYSIFEKQLYRYLLDCLNEFSRSEDNRNVTQFMMWLDSTDGDVCFYIWTKEEEQIEINLYDQSVYGEVGQFFREYGTFTRGCWDRLFDNGEHPDFASLEEKTLKVIEEHRLLFYRACMNVLSQAIENKDLGVLDQTDYFQPCIELREGDDEEYENILRELLPAAVFEQSFPYIAEKLKLHDEIKQLSLEEQMKFWVIAYETLILKNDQALYDRLKTAGYVRVDEQTLKENEYRPFYSIEAEWKKRGKELTPHLLETVRKYAGQYDFQFQHDHAQLYGRKVEKNPYNEIIRECIIFLQTEVKTMEKGEHIQELKELALLFADKESSFGFERLEMGPTRYCVRVLHNWKPDLYPEEGKFENAGAILKHPAYQS